MSKCKMNKANKANKAVKARARNGTGIVRLGAGLTRTTSGVSVQH